MRLAPHLLIRRRVFIATCLATVATAVPVSASSLVVPDDRSTIQEAVNALVDTVFIRNGDYPEAPVLSAQIALLAIPGDVTFERPILAGLQFASSPQVFPLFLVRGLQVSGPATISNDDYLAYIRLERCMLRAGISDISAFPATIGITLRGCDIWQDASLKADGDCIIDSCVFNGGQLIVGEENCALTVTRSAFHGLGRGIAVSTIGQGSDLFLATLTGNVVANYSGGIQMNAIVSVHIEGNVLRDMGAAAIDARSDDVRLVENRVERCGGLYGITVECNADLTFANNVIANCGDSGVLAIVTNGGTIEGNVIWGSRRVGLHLGANPLTGHLKVSNNTSCLNGWSGFLSECLVEGARYEFTGNIGFGNGQYGVRWGVPEVSVVECNDWFANSLGAVSGLPLASEDFETDPLFCSPTSGDFQLFAGSPLVDRPVCGRVGALGVGCDVTATLVRRFTAARVIEGIRIVWEMTEPSIAALVSLERAEAGEQGPWTSVMTQLGHDGPAVTELDQSVITGRPYWYRLVASLSGATTIIGEPILVAPRSSPSFRLDLVGPNPTQGPVQVEFELAERSLIEVAVFDVQGRLVATAAQGVWPAGKHSVTWPTSSMSKMRPGGLYLVRYRYPGGESRARVIRVP